MSLARRALLGERLGLADERHLGREAHRDREGVRAVLEVRLAGGQRTGQVARAPGVHDRPGRGLLRGRGEELDLAPADRLAAGPGGQLLDLGRQGGDVVADDLDQRARASPSAWTPRRSNCARTQVGKVARLRHLEGEHLAGLGAQSAGRDEPFSSPATSASTAPANRVGEVAGDRLLVGLLPALDLLDDHEAPAVAGEEAQRVQRGDGLLAVDALRGQRLDRLGPKRERRRSSARRIFGRSPPVRR